jgi:signal transduction histidine kinase
MVGVAFISAILSGIFYQSRANALYTKNAQVVSDQIRKELQERIDTSRLPENIKDRVEEVLQLRNPMLNANKTLVQDTLEQSIGIVFLVAIGTCLLSWAVGWSLTRRLVGPLERLRQASRKVAEGDFSPRVEVVRQDEVGQVASSFNMMTQQLEDTEKRRRELLSDISHELKTPLASIQGHVEALRDNLPKAKANPDLIYDIVLDDVKELDRMVSSLRTYLNAQSVIEKLELKPLNPGEELQVLSERFKPKAAEKNISLQVQIYPQTGFAIADRDAFRHMVSNLVDNALRYTPEGGQIKLMAWPGDGPQPANLPQPKLTVAVSDTGCGIAPEHWPHLFERFYRVDKSRTRDTGGTGLGLALVKELAQSQNGRVWLNSVPGRGTIFYVALPQAR